MQVRNGRGRGHTMWLGLRQKSCRVSMSSAFPFRISPQGAHRTRKSPIQCLRVRTLSLSSHPPPQQAMNVRLTSPTLSLSRDPHTTVLRRHRLSCGLLGLMILCHSGNSWVFWELCMRSQETAQSYFFIVSMTRPTPSPPHSHPFPSWPNLFKNTFP